MSDLKAYDLSRPLRHEMYLVDGTPWIVPVEFVEVSLSERESQAVAAIEACDEPRSVRG